MYFYTSEINKLISHWQKKKKVLIVMAPILINKDGFEPSYNDLKFTIQNGNYICTNKKVLLTVWQSAASLTHYSFLNSRKTIISEKYAQQINEMH